LKWKSPHNNVITTPHQRFIASTTGMAVNES
jgi:hypothetical protein